MKGAIMGAVGCVEIPPVYRCVSSAVSQYLGVLEVIFGCSVVAVFGCFGLVFTVSYPVSFGALVDAGSNYAMRQRLKYCATHQLWTFILVAHLSIE